MKKFIASTLATLLLVQSIAPNTYAAIEGKPAPVPAPAATTQAPATDTASETASPAPAPAPAPKTTSTSADASATNKVPTMSIETYKSMDLGKANALQILQIAAYGFAYTQGGVAIFNDKPTYTKVINSFLDKYAPNFKYRVGDEVPAAARDQGTAYQESLATDWQKNFSKEYDAVYMYAKNRQASSTDAKTPTPAAAPAPVAATQACTLSKAQEQKLFDAKVQYEKLIAAGSTKEASDVFATIQSIASTCAANTSAIQFTQTCAIAYDRYMTEYKNLIAVNASYDKIKEIKEKISSAEKGDGCTIETTAVQTVEQHQALVAKVKKTIDFGASTVSIIPDNIVPEYCTEGVVNGLKEQLAANDLTRLDQIKTNIENILESSDSLNKGNTRGILNFALGTTATVKTEKLMAANATNKESLAVDSFVGNLAGIADAIIHSKGVTTILGFLDGNLKNVQAMLDSLDRAGGLTSFNDVISQGGNAYDWDGSNFVLNKDAAKQSDITFAFPATKSNQSNNALFTLSALKLHSYDREQEYNTNEIKPELLAKYDLTTAQGFAQAVKNIGNVNNLGIPVSEISRELYDQLKGNGTWTNKDENGVQIDEVNFYMGQVGKQKKAYKDAGLTQYMPAGNYLSTWSRYTIAANGDFNEFYTNELPGQITAKAEVNGKLIAGLDARFTWTSDENLATARDAFPLTVSAKIYLANFLITANFKRENVSGNDWRVSLDASMAGPSICKFTVAARLDYQNGSESTMNIQAEDFKQGQLDIAFNSDELHFAIDQFDALATAIKTMNDAADQNQTSPAIEDIVDIINRYVDATYSFAGEQLAVIKADADKYAVVQYPNGDKEPVMGLAQRYIRLIDTSYIQQVFGDVLGQQKDEKPSTPMPVPPAPSMSVDTKVVNLYTDTTTSQIVDVQNANGNVTITSNTCQSMGGPASASIIAGPGHDVVQVLIGDTTGTCSFTISDASGNFIEIVVNNNGIYVAPSSSPDCKDPKNAPLSVCMMMPAAPILPTLDIAGYSFMSALDPTKFMIGFKTSKDSTNLVAPDSVELTLYYTDGTKATTTLSQDVDGYYLGDNAFGADSNVTEAVVNAYMTIDGTSINASSTLKSAAASPAPAATNQSPQAALNLLK